MLKRFLNVVPVISMLVVAQIQQPAQAADAFCIVKGTSAVHFRGNCIFKQFGGNGSFSIESPSGRIKGEVVMINVYVTEPGVAEVRGLTTSGINSRWGRARRSTSDPACWVGSDFTICAY
jgi:hypothetical protein